MKINKKIFLSVLAVFLLTSCNNNFDEENNSNNNDQTQNNNNDNDDTSKSDNNNDSDDGGSSKDDDDNPSEPVIYIERSISEINKLCDQITTTTDDINVNGNDKVSFVGKMVFTEGVVATSTKNGYLTTNQYKCFVYDNEDWIYIGINSSMYEQLSKYQYKDDEYLSIKGTTHKYLGINEVIVDSYEYIGETTTLNYSLDKLFESKSIEKKTISEVFDIAKNEKINIKGITYSTKIVQIDARYVQKVENAISLFGSETDYIYLHGSDKLNNNFTVENSYHLYCVISMYLYRPQVQFLDSRNFSSEETNVEVNLNNLTTKSGEDIYNVSYTKETTQHSLNYENIFGKIYSFTGYVSYYIKNYNYFFVLDDNLSNSYNAYTNAKTAKTLFVNNENETKISTQKDLTYSNLGKYYQTKISVSFTPYLLNTSGYWQVQIFPETLQELSID